MKVPINITEKLYLTYNYFNLLKAPFVKSVWIHSRLKKLTF